MPQQISDPFRIFDVGLAPRHILDVLGIHHQQLEVAFEYVVHRLPVFACALHRYVRHAFRPQPVRQPQQVCRHRAKRANLVLLLTLHSTCDAARHHRLLVHIQPRTMCCT